MTALLRRLGNDKNACMNATLSLGTKVVSNGLILLQIQSLDSTELLLNV